MNILLIILFIAAPGLILAGSTKIKLIEKIGIVLVCYILGMLVGNIGVLPESFTTSPTGGDSVLSLLQSVTICIALPLVLFSLDLSKWMKIAKKGMLCMCLACLSIIIVTFCIHMVFSDSSAESHKYAAAAVSVYTGGTVNLASIKMAIGMSENDYIIFNTYDAVISVLYIFFLSMIGRKFFSKVFKIRAYEPIGADHGDSANGIDESVDAYKALIYPKNIKGLAVALLISAGIFGVSYVLNILASMINPSLGMSVMMLSITSISIALSFIEKIRNIKHTFQLGMYIIYVFCFSVAACADFKALINFNLVIFVYVAVSIVASLMLHALFSKLAKIDTDTLIITSVSMICSPPFVPAMAASLKNKEILISGLATGVVGYAIGNYLGVAVNYLYALF